VKSYGEDSFLWTMLADRVQAGVEHSLWVARGVRAADHDPQQDVRKSGMDVPITLVPGIGVDELMAARLTHKSRFAAICAAAASAAAAQLRKVVQRRVAVPTRATGSALVSQITQDMKKKVDGARPAPVACEPSPSIMP